MASFADPIIMLFLAGFILAIAASKSGLDTLLARTLSSLSVTRVRMFFWDSYLSQDSSQCSSRTLPLLL